MGLHNTHKEAGDKKFVTELIDRAVECYQLGEQKGRSHRSSLLNSASLLMEMELEFDSKLSESEYVY